MGAAAIAVGLTVLSGYSDSRGFLHAAELWNRHGGISSPHLWRSAVGFAGGIVTWWIALRFVEGQIKLAPELLATLWFAVTILGVALTSGAFAKWAPLDRGFGVAALLLLGLVVYRTA